MVLYLVIQVRMILSHVVMLSLIAASPFILCFIISYVYK
jgi:hypothetical protein